MPALSEGGESGARRRSARQLLWGGVGLAVTLAALLVGWSTFLWSERHSYRLLEDEGRNRLTLYGVALRSELDKSRNIPLILSTDPDVIALLGDDRERDTARPDDKVLALDRRLESMNTRLGVAAVYLITRAGICIASSNWDQGAGSFVGQHLEFRPYFAAAKQGEVGRTFAVGSTAKEPGYYVAMPVHRDGRFVGTVAVKMSMDSLEHGWSGGGERVMVSDRHGIVFITNTPQWRFRSMAPLGPEARDALQTSRQYGEEPLPAMHLARRGALTAVDGINYVMVSQALPDFEGWTLHVLLGVKEGQGRARDHALLAVTLLAVGLLLAYLAVHRARLRRRHTRELEHRVAERTAALLDSNLRLQGEIVERQRAEIELKTKQEELIQAAKLAALGQMSAGMAHEINQPLAAIRSYADNAIKLLELGRGALVQENLAEIAGLTERMARLTGQLKQFARKSSGRLEAVPVAGVVDSALALLAGRIRSESVTVEWSPPDEEIAVRADGIRLQQVLINLLRNALDAMQPVAARRLRIALSARAGTVELAVRDSGRGIDPEAMPQLFDPFFTTKPAGEGLGLGLSISEGIIRDLGGQLSASNHVEGGAVFVVTLPRSEGS